jgi:hypothetical protein
LEWSTSKQKDSQQIIQMAGPGTPSKETRGKAAFRLETLVTGNKNRIDLALNDFEDGSGEYKGAVYQSIYRTIRSWLVIQSGSTTPCTHQTSKRADFVGHSAE